MPPIDPSKIFTESWALVRADDSELEQTLRQDEQLVEQSVSNMQTDFNKLNVSVDSAGLSAANTGQIFGVFGAQMAAVGGIAGNVGGKMASLGSAVTTLGSAIFGLPGIILAATAGLAILVTHLTSASEATDRLREAEEERERQLELQETTRINRQATQFKALVSIEDRNRQLIAAGVGPMESQQVNAQIIDEQTVARIVALRRTVAEAVQEGRSSEVLAEKLLIQSLEEQRVVLREQSLRKLSQLEDQHRKEQDAAEKAAAAERELLRAQQRVAFEATPAGRVIGTLLNAMRANQERSAIAAILKNPLFQLLTPDVLERQIRESLGFGTAGITAGGGIGGGGISTAQFAGGPIVEQAAIVRREGLEQKRTDDLGSLKDEGIPLLRSIAGALAEGLGAN